jgi:hypothetical protein
MYNIVRKFFALHHRISLPGIGNFSVETTPACIDFTDRSISSSQNKIVFSNEFLPVDKKFCRFVSEELNVDEPAALQNFTSFSAHLQHDLDNNNNIYIKGIGRLIKQTESEFVFEPEEFGEYFTPLVAERVIRKNAIHTIRVGEDEKTAEEMHTVLQQPFKIKKEKWWIAAIILAVIGVAAISFYYATH